MKTDNQLKEEIKLKIAISKLNEEENIAMKNKKISIRKTLIAASALFTVTTGIVFAKEITEFVFSKYRLGSESTIDNGYIEQYEENYSNYNASIIKGQNTQEIMTNISIKNFIMSNDSINIDYIVEFDNVIKDFLEIEKTAKGNLNYEKFYNVELTEVYILDEEDNLIYSPYMLSELDNEEVKFKTFCKENNLDLEYGNFNDKYCPNVLNNSLEEFNEEQNKLYMNLSIANNTNLEFPKSQNLRIIIKEIKLIPKDIETRENLDKYISIIGNWNLNIDIPEIMYNREAIEYKVTSIENENFEIISAKATETNFELNLIISNIEKPIMPEGCSRINDEIMKRNGGEMTYPNTREGYLELYGSEELVNKYEQYLEAQMPIKFEGNSLVPWKKETSEGCYILDENNKKFNIILSSSIGNYCYDTEYDENGLSIVKFLNRYEAKLSFDMTKYDTTNKIEITIDYKGTPTKIVLERI